MSTSSIHPPVAAYGAAASPAAPSAARRRVIGAIVAAVALAVLLVASYLEPSPNGIGTHERFNLPPCGWIVLMDLPCPTCGMTTAFAHAADGHLLRGLLTQPLGFLMALGTAMALLLGAYVAATGSRVASVLTRLWGRRTGWLLAGLVLVSWGYKVLSYKGFL